MPEVLTPARLAFAADGTPFSREFGDRYHSADGGAAQAHHVFLRGNGLPERWAGSYLATCTISSALGIPKISLDGSLE